MSQSSLPDSWRSAAGTARAASRESRNGWLTKDAAALQLGVSVRTLERYIDDRKLSTRLQPEAGRKPRVLVDPESVAALAASLSGHRPAVGLVTSGAASLPASMDADVAPHIPPVGETAKLQHFLADLLAAFPVRRPRPWLTLEEAAEYSGLPAPWLLAQARGGSPIAINCGMGGQAYWRFSRRLLVGLQRGA